MLTSTAVGDIDNDITSGSPEMKTEPVIVSVPCDDEIICLDSDEGPSPPPKEAAINSRSTVSRLLLQVIRLHLSERCSSPACKDIMFQAQTLKKKVEEMESVATKLRRTCSAQQKEMTRLSSELAKSNRKLFDMEGVVTRQSNLIRVLEGQLNAIMSTDPRPSPSGHLGLQKPGGSSPLNGRSLNVTRKESPLVQRKSRSDANISHLNGAISPAVNGGRFYMDASTPNNIGTPMGKNASKQPAILSSSSPTLSSHSLNVCNPRTGRISLEVPFVAGSLLQDFSSPIGTPVMDYPAECHHCKVAGPIALTLVIKTEPLNFLLTKKVQGIVKYTAFNGCRPKNVKIYAYLESAVKVRRWASSLVHTFADADKIKFDIILSKDQQVAQYDRIVAFAFASTGMDKFVTSRVVFNIGYPPIMNNNRPVQPPASAQSPVVIEAMETMVDLYPAAVDSDDEIEVDESEDDNDAEDIEALSVKKKKKVAGAANEFAADFLFECSAEDKIDRDDAALKKYLRKEAQSTLDEKIAAIRKAKNTAKDVEIEEIHDDENVEQLGALDAKDRLREKKKTGRRSTQKQDDFFDEAMEVSDSITFEQMNLSRPMLKAIAAAGYTEPTPIQSACIPVALAGKDICACAATGTGKTAAFVLPILERLLYRSNARSCTRILVLVPTRELAIQVFQVFRKLSTYCQIEVCLCAGGLDLKTQEAALRSSPDVVVATPGRLIDHLHNSPSFSLSNIEVLVLDEADRMLEEAFKDQMNELIRLCAPNRQTLLFSATMTDQIDELASMSLKKPVRIFINENTETALKLRQEFIRIRAGREGDREAIIAALVTRTFQENTIVFVKMKKDCQRMHILLGLLGLKVGQMHSSLSQAQRIEALSKFKRREIDVLVSTDLASRGLDIEGIQTVINMHMPKTIKQYIHRVGRTARAGRVGRSISLVGEEERKLLKEIINTNPNRSLKQRQVAPEVVEAYRQRIDSLEDSIRQIDLEEKEEKELRLAEAAVRKTEEKLETGTTEREGRVWFKKSTVGERERKRAERKLLKKEEMKKREAEKTPEQIRIEHEMAYQAREAKRARRGKMTRLRAVIETSAKKKVGVAKKRSMKLSDIPAIKATTPIKKKKKEVGKKSTYTSALTAIGKRSVKKARHGPEDSGFQKARVAYRLKTKKR